MTKIGTETRRELISEMVMELRERREQARRLDLPRTALSIDHAIWVLRAELHKLGREA